MSTRRKPGPSHWARIVTRLCLALAALNLLGALAGGLARFGWQVLPAPLAAQVLQEHGALLMAGFFASLISLERALALHRGTWLPLMSGLAGLLAMAGFAAWAAWAWLLSSIGLCGLYLWAARTRALSLPLAVEASGAAALVWAALAYALGNLEQARWAWSLFLLLTIVGERRELMRLRPLPAWASQLFLFAWALLALAAVLLIGPRAHWGAQLGWLLFGLLALWLLAFDLARLQWRQSGWAGHTARCLMVGYGWLLAASAAGLSGQGGVGGVAWHLMWLGFVFAMVFAHVPIMLPVLLGLRPLHSAWALLPLGLMALSLLLRTFAVLTHRSDWLVWAGAGHGLALVSFALIVALLCKAEAQRLTLALQKPRSR